MKILEVDKRHNFLKIRVENPEDFYILSKFLKEGDLITSKTSRKIKRNNDVFRKSMVVTLEYKNCSYQTFGKRLRISGIIIDGPEDYISKGSYHTVNLETNDIFTLERKNLHNNELKPLKEAEKYTKRPPILLIAIERGVASIGLLSSYELKEVKTLKRNISKEGGEDTKSIIQEFFSDVYEIMKKYTDDCEAVIIAGPGFTKKKFRKFLETKQPRLNIYLKNTSTGTRSGLHEIIRRDIPQEIRKDQRITKETRLIENLLEHIGKNDGYAVYGYKKTKKAVGYGAVKVLIITEKKFFSKKYRAKVMELINQTQEMDGKFHIVSVQHPSGKQLERLGGIGALLRFKLSKY